MSSSSSYPSTSSLLSCTSHASAQPLRPSSAHKDFSAAFGSLQTSYGLGGISKLPSSSSPMPKKQSKLRNFFRPSTSPSSPSFDSPSSLPSSRPSTSNPEISSSASPRDFEAAFATLSGSYGFVGASPSLPSKSQRRRSNLAEVEAPSEKIPAEKRKSPKDREAAFGKLASLQGFNGRAPSMAFR
ncbi:hypothetical protein HGRIS_006883 [Hohenbuehelia grisea]|uniref:Uncharacterized protein n=1 Tax=Hohenbuehelia grisea TaxID=104357 RepID=A0ABR3JAX3_9AGAR